MRHLFEEYGDAILQALGGLGILACIISLVSSDGALRTLIVQILEKAS